MVNEIVKEISMNMNILTGAHGFNSGITLNSLGFVLFCFENFKRSEFDKIMRHLVGVERNNNLFEKANYKSIEWLTREEIYTA